MINIIMQVFLRLLIFAQLFVIIFFSVFIHINLPLPVICAMTKLISVIVCVLLVGLRYVFIARPSFYNNIYLWVLGCGTSINILGLEYFEQLPKYIHFFHSIIIVIPFLAFIYSPYVKGLSKLKTLPFISILKKELPKLMNVLLFMILINLYYTILGWTTDVLFCIMIYSYIPMSLVIFWGISKTYNGPKKPIVLKKLQLFFRLHGDKAYDIRVIAMIVLPIMSFTPIMMLSFLFSSLMFDGFFSAKIYLECVMCASLIMCSPEVQNWVLNTYGPDALRLLSWNIISKVLSLNIKTFIFVGAAGGLATVGLRKVYVHDIKINISDYEKALLLYNKNRSELLLELQDLPARYGNQTELFKVALNHMNKQLDTIPPQRKDFNYDSFQILKKFGKDTHTFFPPESPDSDGGDHSSGSYRSENQSKEKIKIKRSLTK